MKFPQIRFPRWFVRRSSLLIAVAVAFLIAGCDPYTVVQWAPDGEHALVFGATGAVVIDAEGKILGATPQARVWMPDSRHVLAVRLAPAKSWEEIAPLLNYQRTQAVLHASEGLAALVRDFHGQWKDFLALESFKQWAEGYRLAAGIYPPNEINIFFRSNNEELLPFFYLSQKNPDLMAPVVKEMLATEDTSQERPDVPKAQLDEFLKSPLGKFTPAIEELVLRNALPGEPAEEKILWRCADDLAEVSPSPDGKKIAVITREPERPAMYVIWLEDGSQYPIDFGMNQAAWSPDSQWLVYAKTAHAQGNLNDSVVLGTITRTRPGHSPKIPPESDVTKTPPASAVYSEHMPEDLAGVLCSKGNDSVACLPDGRILFAGVSGTYPAPVSQSQKLKFYLLNPENQKIEEVPGADSPAYLPTAVDLFSTATAEGGRMSLRGRSAIGIPSRKWSLSPDGKRVAVLGSGGNVALVTLATGAIEVVQPGMEGTDTKGALANKTQISNVIPSWRGASELTYVSFDSHYGPGSKRAEVALRDVTAGTTRFISAGWSNDFTDDFLPLPKGADVGDIK